MFEDRVLRRIFGPKREEITGRWRRLHNGVVIIKMKEDWMGRTYIMYGRVEKCIQKFHWKI
jgi:hypothetical protein